MSLNRRRFLRGATASVALCAGFWHRAFAQSAIVGRSPYGELLAPDEHGVRLPQGFRARLIGFSGQPVAGTSYVWHGQPDGGATFALPSGDWVYACNSELGAERGGAGAVRFDADGRIAAAYRILEGTDLNCAGGPTPWGTWLSCEEHLNGLVWECDPRQPGQGVARPALGRFIHEAAAVDPRTGYVYLTEDDRESRLYRFRPSDAGNLEAGTLEAATTPTDGRVDWIPVAIESPCRTRGTAVFRRGEGAWFNGGALYFCTTADHRVWALDTATDELAVVYDAEALGSDAPLRFPDNVTVHAASGDIYVAEDGDDLQLVLLADGSGSRIAAPFLQLVDHRGSEIAGPAFSPDGTRLYVSSQRGRNGDGMTFEIVGPFRRG